MSVQLSQKEQELLVLGVVEACIQYSKTHDEDFGIVLKELIFIGESKTDLSTMYCKTIKSLCEKEYILGNVEIAYIPEYDRDTLEGSETDEIDFDNTRFTNISISPKGKALLEGNSLKVLKFNVTEKVRSALSCLIGNDATKEILVETATNFICALL